MHVLRAIYVLKTTNYKVMPAIAIHRPLRFRNAKSSRADPMSAAIRVITADLRPTDAIACARAPFRVRAVMA